MSKISELSDGGSLVSSDYLIAVRSGGNVKVRMDQINVDQVDLGDNEFIRLGNSQDLTMVHTSTQSIINQAGIGDLLLQKAGATKLTINASGIDVTGSVTAGAATFSGDVNIDKANPILIFKESAAAKLFIGESSAVGGGAGFYDFYAVTGLGQRFFTNSIQRMTISSAGNVGIGTSSPASPTGFGSSGILHLKGATGNDCSIVLEGLTGSGGRQEIGASGGALQFYRGAATGSMSESMRIDSSGKLLVGKTSAGDYVTGVEMQPAGAILSYRTTNVASIFGRTNDGEITRFTSAGAVVGSIGAKTSMLTIGSGDVGLYFDSTNNRIIPFNTTTQVNNDAVFDIGAAAYRVKDLYLSGVAKADSLQFAQNSAATGATEAVYRPTTGSMAFKTNSGERMRIDASGNLLVGKTAVSFATAGIELKDSNVISITRSAGTALNANRIGSSAGSLIIMHYDSIDVGSIDVTASATSYTTSSDQRLKENIADADDAGSKIDAIQVRKFDWKVDGSHQDYGMVAQELMTVAPEAVSQGETEDDMMGVDYSKLVPMMLKEIQSLRARIAALES